MVSSLQVSDKSQDEGPIDYECLGRQLMVKVLQALLEHKRVSQIKNAKVATANQEYTYWLGKRVISSLRSYRARRLTEREVV